MGRVGVAGGRVAGRDRGSACGDGGEGGGGGESSRG